MSRCSASATGSGWRNRLPEEAREIRLGLLAEGATAVINKDHFEFIDNVLKTPGVNYLGKMFRDGERLIQLVKVEEIVPAEFENMLVNVRAEDGR